MLPREFYLRSTKQIAKDLLGQIFICNGIRLRIVETEAYLGLIDPAAHSYHGKKTERVKPMYLPGGHSYVYLIYGMYYCINIVTRSENHPEAVLIRALEPSEDDLPRVRKLRDAKRDIDLLNGPGKLCKTLGITQKYNALDITKKSSAIRIEEGEKLSRSRIGVSGRIGIESRGAAAEWPLRFFDSQSKWVSRY